MVMEMVMGMLRRLSVATVTEVATVMVVVVDTFDVYRDGDGDGAADNEHDDWKKK